MSAGHWVQGWNWNFGSKVSSAVQGVYTPVAPSPGVKRSPACMGTPEIFFTKNIDNSRLVKAADHERNREIAMFCASAACVFVLIMVYALQHFSSIEYGYKIEAQKKLREEIIESNRALRLEEASLRDPERIDVLARRMGLESPQAGQVLHLEPVSDGGTPVMARMTDVPVLVAQ